MRYRHTMTLFGISLPICLILRVLQSVFTIDSSTGFIKQQYSDISTVIMLVIFAGIASVGLMGLISDGVVMRKKNKNILLSVAAFAVGAVFLFDIAASASVVAGAWYDMLILLLGAVCSAVFIAYGLKNVYSYNFPSMLLVLPVIYYVVKLISVFVSTSDLALVTENIFLLFTNGSLLLFMFEFAKIENEIDETPKPKKFFAVSLITVMFCEIQAIPKILFYGAVLSVRDLADAVLNMVMGVFVLIYFVSNFGDSRTSKNTKPAKHLAE